MLMPSIFERDLFDDFFDGFGLREMRPTHPMHPTPLSQAIMKTDVMENEDGYELSIELPGFKKEDVKATLRDGYLSIAAETRSENDEKNDNGKYIRRERYFGSCSRSFFVGKDIKQSDIKAKFSDGILTVQVPKIEKLPENKVDNSILIEG